MQPTGDEELFLFMLSEIEAAFQAVLQAEIDLIVKYSLFI